MPRAPSAHNRHWLTIRQNYSRDGSLDYIINNGATIIEAVSSQKWTGEAAVYVSIVSWIKGQYDEEKSLYFENKKQVLVSHKVNIINSSLSLKTDVSIRSSKPSI